MRRWIAFDGRLTDGELAECFEPYVLTEIDRERGVVESYSIDHNLSHFSEGMQDTLAACSGRTCGGSPQKRLFALGLGPRSRTSFAKTIIVRAVSVYIAAFDHIWAVGSRPLSENKLRAA